MNSTQYQEYQKLLKQVKLPSLEELNEKLSPIPSGIDCGLVFDRKQNNFEIVRAGDLTRRSRADIIICYPEIKKGIKLLKPDNEIAPYMLRELTKRIIIRTAILTKSKTKENNHGSNS